MLLHYSLMYTWGVEDGLTVYACLSSLQVHSSGAFWTLYPLRMKRVRWFCSLCPTKTSLTRRRTRILSKDLTQVYK